MGFETHIMFSFHAPLFAQILCNFCVCDYSLEWVRCCPHWGDQPTVTTGKPAE